MTRSQEIHPGSLDGARASFPVDFEAELRPLLRPALRLAAGLLGDPTEAEDAVQEAALLAWRRAANRWPDSDLRPWFLAIVANRCRERRRGRWARVLRIADPPPPAASGDDHEGDLDVRAALRALPYDARLALVLRHYLDLSFDDVSVVLGCSVEAARSRVRRAAAQISPSLQVVEGLA